MSLDIPQILFGDAILYHNLALGLLNEQTFHGTLRMPGYPSFIAFIYWIFGVNPGAVLAVQILLHILTIFVLYYSSFAPLLGGFGGKKSIRMAKKMVKGTRICGI